MKWCLCFLIHCLGLSLLFFPRSRCLLISWLQSPSAVILEPKRRKSDTVSTFSPSICHDVVGLILCFAMDLNGCHDLNVFWMLSLKLAFSLSSFTLIKRLFSSSLLSAIRVESSAKLRFWYFTWQSWLQLVIHPAWHFSGLPWWLRQ